jgi:hypothetical protein
MLHLLADENIPASALAALRARGHDTQSIREDAPGSIDDEVLSRARSENRWLLTCDRLLAVSKKAGNVDAEHRSYEAAPRPRVFGNSPLSLAISNS